ncbi:MAG TPA: hypothetical protein VJ824_13010 [Bacillota bacterium]|nr:hypothetical protein [Bacillota bacterium]
MKTLEFVIENYKSNCIDGRDLNRLANFIPEKDLEKIGLSLNEEYKGTHEHKEFTRENILEQLERDVQFGFEKANNQRGISSAMMFEVVKMWNWILEDGLEDFNNYGSYGMPLFVDTAEKYGWELQF